MYQFFQDESGTATLEYSLFISLIGLVIAGALHSLGTNLIEIFSSINGGMNNIQVIDGHRRSDL